MSLNQIFIAARARLWLMAAILFVVVVSSAVVSWSLPKSYSASAAVVLDVKTPDPIAGMVLPAMFQPGYMATQIDILRSERVLRGTINRLNLSQNPQLRELWQSETKGAPGTLEPWLANLLAARLSAVPAKESNVINISYSAPDPMFAAAVANAVVDSYIETSLELRVEPAKQYRSMFESQAKAARERLELAQAKLSEYQRRMGLVATDERMDIENTRLAELSSQLVAMQAARADASSRSNAALAGSDRSPEAIANPVIARLQSELALLEAKLKEAQANLGDAHPYIVQLKANVAELRSRVASETARVNASLGINTRASLEREGVIRNALDQQRERVLALKAQRDQASVLIKDVEAAQQAYDRIMARVEQTSLESQSTQTNVSVVKRATPPYAPSSPNVLLNVLLAFVLGSILAFGTALALELWDRRLRSDEDIATTLQLPVLGHIGDSRKEDGAPMGRMLSLSGPTSRALPTLTGPSA